MKTALKLVTSANPERLAVAQAIAEAAPARAAVDKARTAAEAARGAFADALGAVPAVERAVAEAKTRLIENPAADRSELRTLRQAETDARDDLEIAQEVAARAELRLADAERSAHYAAEAVQRSADLVIVASFEPALKAAEEAAKEFAQLAFDHLGQALSLVLANRAGGPSLPHGGRQFGQPSPLAGLHGPPDLLHKHLSCPSLGPFRAQSNLDRGNANFRVDSRPGAMRPSRLSESESSYRIPRASRRQPGGSSRLRSSVGLPRRRITHDPPLSRAIEHHDRGAARCQTVWLHRRTLMRPHFGAAVQSYCRTYVRNRPSNGRQVSPEQLLCCTLIRWCDGTLHFSAGSLPHRSTAAWP